jgi:hypothetical protein
MADGLGSGENMANQKKMKRLSRFFHSHALPNVSLVIHIPFALLDSSSLPSVPYCLTVVFSCCGVLFFSPPLKSATSLPRFRVASPFPQLSFLDSNQLRTLNPPRILVCPITKHQLCDLPSLSLFVNLPFLQSQKYILIPSLAPSIPPLSSPVALFTLQELPAAKFVAYWHRSFGSPSLHSSPHCTFS